MFVKWSKNIPILVKRVAFEAMIKSKLMYRGRLGRTMLKN
jgi:hypothetical protein